MQATVLLTEEYVPLAPRPPRLSTPLWAATGHNDMHALRWTEILWSLQNIVYNTVLVINCASHSIEAQCNFNA